MKILIIGNGGREHAIAWKLHKDEPSHQLFCAPGNAGTARIATNLPLSATDVPGILAWTETEKPDFAVIGPETPLCLGLADKLTALGVPTFGPVEAAARLEGSKAFAKEVMKAAQVPTADARIVHTAEEARATVREFGIPVVLKADGLAAGKGVSVCMTEAEFEKAMEDFFLDNKFGKAADSVLIEQYLEGEEASVLAFVDGTHILPMVSAQDHKRLRDGDEGPNTGGMGAYSPAPAMTEDMFAVVESQILKPVVEELQRRGITYKGVLYAGLMLTANGPKVLEFNCRFGDPETQAVLARLASPLIEPMRACIEGTLDRCTVKWSEKPAVCVVMAAGGYPGAYEKGAPIDGIDEAEHIPGVVVFHAGTARKGGQVITDGGRVLGVTATGADIRDAVRNAYRGVLKIKFDQQQYRTDIAYRALNRDA